MKDSKYYKKMKKKNESFSSSNLWMTKLLLSIIIVLLCLIVSNLNHTFKDAFQSQVLEHTIHFSNIHKFYDKYIGSLTKSEETVPVSSTVSSIHQLARVENNGTYTFSVEKEYPVSFLESGIIVFIGDKYGLSDTVIVQGNDGVDLWYSHVLVSAYSLYDYVRKGDILGTSIDDTFLLTIMKDGNTLKYEDYFA